MTALRACFSAERIKWRRSWLILPILLAPLCQTGLLFTVFWFSEFRVHMFRPGFLFWLELNHAAWNLVVMPVAVAMMCELSWEQERESRAWKHLLIQPVPRNIHYLVKVLSHGSLVLLAQALLAMLMLIGGFLLQTQPSLQMGPLPLGTLIRFSGFSVLSSLAVVAFHTWLPLRASGIWVSLAVAIVGSWLTLRLLGTSPMILALPWGLAIQMSQVFDRWRVLPWAYVPGSLLAASALTVLGTLDFSKHHKSMS